MGGPWAKILGTLTSTVLCHWRGLGAAGGRGDWRPQWEHGGEPRREAAGLPHSRRSKQHIPMAATDWNRTESLYLSVLQKWMNGKFSKVVQNSEVKNYCSKISLRIIIFPTPILLSLFTTYFHFLFLYYIHFNRPPYIFWTMVRYNKLVVVFLFSAKHGNVERDLATILSLNSTPHSSPAPPWCSLLSSWSSSTRVFTTLYYKDVFGGLACPEAEHFDSSLFI